MAEQRVKAIEQEAQARLAEAEALVVDMRGQLEESNAKVRNSSSQWCMD